MSVAIRVVLVVVLVGSLLTLMYGYLVATRSEPYPDEAAERPAGGETMAIANALGFEKVQKLTDVPYVDGGHPADCTKWCCHEERIGDLVMTFDWERAERELTS